MNQIKHKLIALPLYTKCFALFSSFILAYGCYKFEVPKYSAATTVLFFTLLIFVSSIAIFIAKIIPIHTNVRIYSLIFSFLFSCIYICFNPIYIANGNDSLRSSLYYFLSHFPYIYGLTVVLSAILSILIFLISSVEDSLSAKTQAFFTKPLLTTAIIFLCWVPCYLSYYPGIMSYDMFAQTPQALGLEPISKYHPPLHTLFWKMFLEIEKHTGLNALVFYSITQMLILAACLGYTLRLLALKKMHPVFLSLSLIYFCLNPVIAIFSFIPAKDVLFAATLILFITELLYIITSDGINIPSSVRFIIVGSLCCLLRNNMIYAFVVSILFTLLFIRKHRLRIGIYSLAIALCYTVISGPVYDKAGIQGGNPREMLSIPIQQLSYVVVQKGDELTAEDINNINQYLPSSELWYLYKTRNVDLIKVRFNTANFISNPKHFFTLWSNILGRYTDECLVAFLNLNSPYWYPSASTIDPNTIAEYIETCIYTYEQTGYEIYRDSKLPQLNSFYEYIAKNAHVNFPIGFSTLFSITTPIWIILFTMLVLLCKKQYTLLAVVFPTFFLWCTYLLGPVSNCRYVFPIMLCYPVYMLLTFQSSKLSSNEE